MKYIIGIDIGGTKSEGVRDIIRSNNRSLKDLSRIVPAALGDEIGDYAALAAALNE